MSAVVVNRIELRVPVDQLVPDLERELVPALRAQAGFEGARIVKVGPTTLVVLLDWASPEAAAAGAAVIGPGVFNTYVAPHTESQDRVVGEVVLAVG